MQSKSRVVVVLATGGTIAGVASHEGDNVAYVAGVLDIETLVGAVPALGSCALELATVAQVDSKDMSHTLWRQLAAAAEHHLARPEVAGVVVTHGTDTMEETAWFLQRVLAPAKPLVLTGAMRPANALHADGPQNMLDAVVLAGMPGAQGVLVVMEGRAHAAVDVRKVDGYRLDAFTSGASGPVALLREGDVTVLRPWPSGVGLGLDLLPREGQEWPRVDILVSHAGCDGALVAAAQALGCRGLVVEGTGNGTLHHRLESALREAMAQGVAVRRASRCQSGVVGGGTSQLPSAGELTPAKARVELMLTLMASPQDAAL